MQKSSDMLRCDFIYFSKLISFPSLWWSWGRVIPGFPPHYDKSK